MSLGIKASTSVSGGGGTSLGKIVVDTTGLVTTDTIRVQSLLDSSILIEETIDNPGDLLVFEVPGANYYKIALVQEIENIPTEVVTVKKALDTGMCLPINILSKTSLSGIQSILNAHAELEMLNIGDEIELNIVGGTTWTMQIAAINLYSSHEVIFVSKKIYTKSTTNYIYTSSNVRTAMQSFYTNIEPSDKQYIKEVTRSTSSVPAYDDYVWCLGSKEAMGSGGVSSQSQFPLFVTQANRIRTYNSAADVWWLSDHYDGSSVYIIDASGNYTYTGVTYSRGVVPCFTLKADV